MIEALGALLLFQLVGEVTVRLTALPLPGPVVGMALLFLALVARGRVPAALRDTATGLLQHLSLLFVPAGVGVVTHLSLVREEWAPIAAALVGSTLLTIVVTALTMRGVERLLDACGRGDPS